eukprot:TRINITY_DN7832_c0_g1_i1.p1 TRINITY_DN7832_c0_g1~~TRINITY_DN7832_c0_g1_i1.p1  ORF type:complete len:244 (+),score=58.13 TRINITY_DN7832_c0_g1_i1:55-786(+)
MAEDGDPSARPSSVPTTEASTGAPAPTTVPSDGATATVSAGPAHFNMAAEDDGDITSVAGRSHAAQQDLAWQVREKFRFLSPDDQKTVCRRECQVALRREEAAMQQLQQTIEAYVKALEISRAVDSGAIPTAPPPPGVSAEPPPGAVLDPALATKYSERVRILRGGAASVDAVPVAALPKLTAVEEAKGLVFTSYASTAEAASRLVGAPALDGARTAFSSLASRFRRGGYGGGGGGGGSAVVE